ncbi:glycosyltransferase [Novosphingobium sp. P6W]|uniref:glycosyltransferase n=1 Tax=Novosphingobium sp. P6W TaxID=1609758 RepID=UPI0005C2E956|nr:glycosyltransferase [Novosphingobium sp. P6W]AXB76558.1 glycosyltransferase [Novosphingobium sp. P6W]KIS30804.1 glycosyl transferase family 1 [Novosphingobium sp. P6W]
MKIVDVCAFYSPHGGGVRTYIEQKLRIGPQLGHEIVVIVPGEAHETLERGPGARIVTLPSPRFPLDRKYGYFADEAALHAALDAERPDVVEVSSPWRSPSMVARWQGAARRSLVMHADPLSAYAYRWFSPVLSRPSIDRGFERYWAHLRHLGRAFDMTVCANHDLAGRLRAGGVAGVRVHPLGVETTIFSPERRDANLRADLLALCGLDANARLLVAAGRLAPEKRWPMVVDAVAAASLDTPVGLVLFGEGREKRAIRSAIGGNPHIRLFEPERDRAAFAAILASADAVVHGCEAETFCMVGAEARASGTAVIVPDSGGAADHARSGAGHTYRAGNRFSLTDAIVAFCERGPRPQGTSGVVSNVRHFEKLFADYGQFGCNSQAA